MSIPSQQGPNIPPKVSELTKKFQSYIDKEVPKKAPDGVSKLEKSPEKTMEEEGKQIAEGSKHKFTASTGTKDKGIDAIAKKQEIVKRPLPPIPIPSKVLNVLDPTSTGKVSPAQQREMKGLRLMDAADSLKKDIDEAKEKLSQAVQDAAQINKQGKKDLLKIEKQIGVKTESLKIFMADLKQVKEKNAATSPAGILLTNQLKETREQLKALNKEKIDLTKKIDNADKKVAKITTEIINLGSQYENTVKEMANTFESGSRSTPEDLFREKGVVRTAIPIQMSLGIGEPKNQNEVETMIEALQINMDRVREVLILQIPDTVLDMNRGVGDRGEFFGNNNYVFSLAQHPNIVHDPEKKTLTIEDKTFKIANAYTVVNERIVLGEKLMCDDGVSYTIKNDEGKNLFSIHSFNDGNGWGKKSQVAAEQANEKAIRVLEEELNKLYETKKDQVTSRDIIRAQDKALFAAHKHLTELRKKMGTAGEGTTCPQIMTVAGDILHLTSIGDSKAFIIKSDLTEVKEPTLGNRGGFDATDPGGRIGQSKVDARNLLHVAQKLDPGDIVVMCSDGIHDNFDPKMLGMAPKDFQLTGDTWKDWDDNNPEHVKARNDYIGAKMQEVLQNYKNENNLQNLSQEDVSKALNSYVQNTTLKRKLEMIVSATTEPEDKKEFPGKMDHAGLIVYKHPI